MRVSTTQPAAAERAATNAPWNPSLPPMGAESSQGCRRCRRRGAAFLALFLVGGRRGSNLMAIVSFSLEILAPPRPRVVATNVGARFVFSQRWARSVPASGINGRIIHSRRFEELWERSRSSSTVDLVNCHRRLAAGGQWCGRRRRTGSRSCAVPVLFFRFGFDFFDLGYVGRYFADEFPSAFGVAGFGSFSFLCRRRARPEARYRRKPFRGRVMMMFCGGGGVRPSGTVIQGRLDGSLCVR